MKKSHRISVRLDEDQWARFQDYAMEAGITPSTFVRLAFDKHLTKAVPGADETVLRPLAPPEQIGSLLPKYLGWGDQSRDIRKERERLYCELLAAAFVCKKLFPLTPGLTESYIELRQLAKSFGIQENV